ncbi:15680_t:CDS:1, partial [Funneliformis geosporum]
KELENKVERFKRLHRERETQRMPAPECLSKKTIEKRVERARKIYDLFSTIGVDQFQHHRSTS